VCEAFNKAKHQVTDTDWCSMSYLQLVMKADVYTTCC